MHHGREFGFPTPRPEFATGRRPWLVLTQERCEVPIADIPPRAGPMSIQPSVSHHEVHGRPGYPKTLSDILKAHEAVGIVSMLHKCHDLTVSALRAEVVDPCSGMQMRPSAPCAR